MNTGERELDRVWQKAERAKLRAVAIQKQIVALLRDIAADPTVERIDREIAHRRADALEKSLVLADGVSNLQRVGSLG